MPPYIIYYRDPKPRLGTTDLKDVLLTVMFQTIFLSLSFQVYVVVGIAGVALTGCVLMVIILKYGRNSKFGIKGELFSLKE